MANGEAAATKSSALILALIVAALTLVAVAIIGYPQFCG
jgi:flagellar basal body-associated protein FliL